MDCTIKTVKTKNIDEITSMFISNKVESFNDIDTMFFINEVYEDKIPEFIKIQCMDPSIEEEDDFKFILKKISETFKDKLIILESLDINNLYSPDDNSKEDEDLKYENTYFKEMFEEIGYIDINTYYDYCEGGISELNRHVYVYREGIGLDFAFSINNFLEHKKKEKENNK